MPALVVMEQGNSADVKLSSNWLKAGRCSTQQMHLMVIMKKRSAQRAKLEETFWAVSDPDHPDYGKHLNSSQITEIIGADSAAILHVVQWLRKQGAISTDVAAQRDAIEVSMLCQDAERAFATTVSTFVHARANELTLHRAAAPYSLPHEIAQYVSMVGDLISLPELRLPLIANMTPSTNNKEGVSNFPASCNDKCGDTFVTPAVLTKAYKLGAAPASAKGSIAVAEFQGVQYDRFDIASFSSACGVDLKVKNVGGASGLECAIPLLGTELCGEALLDIEYAGSLSGAIPLTDIFNSQYSLLKWATQISNMASPPLIHSVSYGNDEAQQTSEEYMLEANIAFMKLGAMGISVLFASGDQGVLGREGIGAKYHPDFPASSPYITAVGGTDFVAAGMIGKEKAWSLGGGGFSNTFVRPAYQKAAVEAFLSKASELPPKEKWNSTGRAYPDLSALGGQVNPYCIRAGSLFAGVAGTSASCPVVAAVFAKLNELRLSKGGKPLGFLNPWIYKHGSAFNDVTQGRNCGSPFCLPTAGFPAVKGWDAATGFGSPNFEKLSALI
eukprot:CAMPEP_0119330464 /NCGR_PEP_ID=MMETSP1333-20130426/78333_1 /TAXON_ID=418940 /ORGANISM="Scyphosphaera apsteinii, Strain RCC1455" /LENGTH=556 /DNA_ID=CAMNT_0007339859 /DNA_START=35 /DNA_END=1705 /DNA_ORIENTATION=-